MNDQPNTTDDVEGHAGSPAGLATGLGEGAVYGLVPVGGQGASHLSQPWA
ncbi:MAG: hypothetical protein WKF73_22255 [Nocardioidaceae bacterium]